MKAVLPRTASVPVLMAARPGSFRICLSHHDSISGIFSGERRSASSPKISMNLEINSKKIGGIRRALSESDIFGSETDFSGGFPKLSRAGSGNVPSRIPEEDVDADDYGSSSTMNNNKSDYDYVDFTRFWPEDGTISVDGFNKGRNYVGNDDKRKIGDYYRELLKSNPTDSLILRNYGKFLHEIEKDDQKAEEYYGRAILASPGDGELLSLYGNLIWMTQRDEERAKSYFDQAVTASPNDCTVLGSYACFMWEMEEEKEEEEANQAAISPAMVAAF